MTTPTGHGLDTHRTRLGDSLPGGEVELIAEDDAVIHKARQACGRSGEMKSFVFWDGQYERTVTGTVARITEGTPFRFCVRPDENGVQRLHN